MAISKMTAEFPVAAETIWGIITSLEEYSWRSDIDKIEVAESGKRFIEYTGKYATTFTITAWEPCKRYEFTMENENMQGHWTGIFTEQAEKTRIDFTEKVEAKKWFMKPFVGMYLKKQQAGYLKDLQQALEKDREE
ncbi:MAG: SRPBCC family protein [Lachnospiraceae bacterium]|nr:SRPBCC family protein [Lachnospiraceae bacterium]